MTERHRPVRRNVAARWGGVALLAASFGCCLWLRALMPEPPHDPTLLEALLVLASFVLSLSGLVLILAGREIIGDPAARQREDHPAADLPTPTNYGDERSMLAAQLVERVLHRSGRDQR